MKKNKKLMITLGVVGIIFLVIGVTYGFWKLVIEQPIDNQIRSKCFHLEFLEEKDTNIQLKQAYPISDEDGKKLVPYQFTIKNECSEKAKYTIRLEVSNDTNFDGKYLKVLLNSGKVTKLNELTETAPKLDNMKTSYILEEMVINGGEEKTYELRIWIDGGVSPDNQEVMNKMFSGKIHVEGDYDVDYTEELLHGADPVLKEGLIPVTIENENGKNIVRKADTKQPWYSYQEKQWANAIILENKEETYKDGEEIPESNIESYFVWIPRYRYKIFDNGMYNELSSSVEKAEQEIEIIFEDKTTQLSKGSKEGDWLTHPAFTAFDVNGLWVGKFETGYKGANETADAEKNIEAIDKVEIKPNVYSWRGIQVANAHLNSYGYKREYDSHMMKNTEWGAVAYLSHSAYGNPNEIRYNNNSDYKTGYAGVHNPTIGYTGTSISCTTTPEACNEYGTTSDITRPWNDVETLGFASTTGNVTGIYDMSGGVWEYVMGVVSSKDGNLVSGFNTNQNSNFNGILTSTNEVLSGHENFPESKYYDIYAYGEVEENFSRRILGDATGEMGPFENEMYNSKEHRINSWYGDEAYYIYSKIPWVERGSVSYLGTQAGIFAFTFGHGSAHNATGFRIVLAI